MLLLIFMIICSLAKAGDLHLLSADRLDVEYDKLDRNNRDPYAPQYTGEWDYRAALRWDVGLINHIGYWKNNVHMETAGDGQAPKTLGWEFEAGFHVLEYLDLYEYHHSRHLADQSPPVNYQYPSGNQFPVENAYGIRIHIIPQQEGSR